MNDREGKIQKLTSYFLGRDDVILAFLFGSQVSDNVRSLSDWDIAVYFRPQGREVELEELAGEYPNEDEVWKACMDILQTDSVDLIVLNRAPATLFESVLKGRVLVNKSSSLYTHLMLRVTEQAEDYRSFVEDFYAISERSRSLVPQDRERLQRIILFLEEQIKLYDHFGSLTQKTYEENIHLRNEVERWIENIMNASIDIAKVILASERRRIPETYRAAIGEAVRFLGLPSETEAKLESWAKLRNILAHEYIDIKWQRISTFVKESRLHIESYCNAVKNFLEQKKSD